MNPRDEVQALADRVYSAADFDRGSLADALSQAYLIGVEAAWRMDQEAGSVFRILRPDGKPFDRRAWTASGPANLSLRHGPKGGRLQEGKVVWLKEGDSE